MKAPSRRQVASAAEAVRRDLEALLGRAGELHDELDALRGQGGPAEGRRYLIGSELRRLERMITLAACELVPRDDPRRRAAERVAADLRRAA